LTRYTAIESTITHLPRMFLEYGMISLAPNKCSYPGQTAVPITSKAGKGRHKFCSACHDKCPKGGFQERIVPHECLTNRKSSSRHARPKFSFLQCDIGRRARQNLKSSNTTPKTLKTPLFECSIVVYPPKIAQFDQE